MYILVYKFIDQVTTDMSFSSDLKTFVQMAERSKLLNHLRREICEFSKESAGGTSP